MQWPNNGGTYESNYNPGATVSRVSSNKITGLQHRSGMWHCMDNGRNRMSTWNNLDYVDLVVLCWLGAMPVGMLLILVWDFLFGENNE